MLDAPYKCFNYFLDDKIIEDTQNKKILGNSDRNKELHWHTIFNVGFWISKCAFILFPKTVNAWYAAQMGY